MENKKYYFTYGVDEIFPYFGGWTEVESPDMETAKRIYNAVHETINGFGNYAFCYSEEEFKTSKMCREGNFGHKCWETISVTIIRYAH